MDETLTGGCLADRYAIASPRTVEALTVMRMCSARMARRSLPGSPCGSTRLRTSGDPAAIARPARPSPFLQRLRYAADLARAVTRNLSDVSIALSMIPEPVEPLLHGVDGEQIGWFEDHRHLPRYPTNPAAEAVF